MKYAIGFLLLFLVMFVGYSVTHMTEDVVTIQVTDKNIKNSSSSDSDGNTSVSNTYMIYGDVVEPTSNTSEYITTGEVEVFTNTDSWTYGKFNSSDVYAKLKVGAVYELTVTGYRIQWMSTYRNIVGFKQLPAKSK